MPDRDNAGDGVGGDPMRRVLIPQDLPPAPPPAGGRLLELQGLSMGSSWSVKLIADDSADESALRRAIEQELARVVEQMSTWEPDSDLSRYNQAPAGSWWRLPAEFQQVLRCAVQAAADSEGAYDPTAGPLVNCWGFGPGLPRSEPPTVAEIDAARARVGWPRMQFDPASGKLQQPGGVYLDLSAIAKGFGVDQAFRRLQREGIAHCLVEVGGELRGQGCKPDGSPWWVALERPEDSARVPETLLALHGLSVATSGDYRRFFEHAGRRYAHTIDPRSGHPASNALASVTVVHPECMVADVLATILTVLGPEQGFDYAAERGIAALLLIREAGDFSERITPALAALQA